jgi:hypothetical protein
MLVYRAWIAHADSVDVDIQTAFRDPRATAMRDLNDALSGQSLDRSTGQRADRGQLA